MTWLDYVQTFEDAASAARRSPPPLPLPKASSSATRPSAPLALICAPHPDDECIIGLLPLRLQQELGWHVCTVPITHGSLPARQEARHSELKAACDYLGWQLAASPEGSESEPRPAHCAESLQAIVKSLRPDWIFFPHSADWNTRHISTHRLVIEVLQSMPADFSCTVVETEYWAAMPDPNLMIGASAQSLSTLVTALTLHTGEVARNPYHLLLPAWMMDNVRRGAELVAGQGSTALGFLFATLYRRSLWKNGIMNRCPSAVVSPEGDLRSLSA